MPANDQRRIALLIDAENTSSTYIDIIFNELAPYGLATYKRVYGNINAITRWEQQILQYAMTPVLQLNYTKGKNASDSALIIDAIDILHANNVEGFCLVTSDSDFTKLAIRLREAGMFVLGMGKEQTPESLKRACEEFKYLDAKYNDVKPESEAKTDSKSKSEQLQQETESPEVMKLKRKLKNDIDQIFDTVFRDKEWVSLSELGSTLPKYITGFTIKAYGCSKLSRFVEKFPDIFEIRKDNTHTYVRNKQ